MSRGKGFARNRKAVGTVIAALVLLALTVGIIFTYSSWGTSIQGSFTTGERVEVAAVEVDLVPQGWQLNVLLKNSGSVDTEIISLKINGKTFSTLGVSTNPDLTSDPLLLEAGSTDSIQVVIPTGTQGCSSGSTIEIEFASTNGLGHMQMVSLT